MQKNKQLLHLQLLNFNAISIKYMINIKLKFIAIV